RAPLWLEVLEGSISLEGETVLPGESPLPVTRTQWAQAAASTRVRVLATDALLRDGAASSAVERWHRHVLRRLGAERPAAAAAAGIEVRPPQAGQGLSYGVGGIAAVSAIAEGSRFRVRRVMLRGDWWRRDNGPLLGFLRQSGDRHRGQFGDRYPDPNSPPEEAA